MFESAGSLKTFFDKISTITWPYQVSLSRSIASWAPTPNSPHILWLVWPTAALIDPRYTAGLKVRDRWCSEKLISSSYGEWRPTLGYCSQWDTDVLWSLISIWVQLPCFSKMGLKSACFFTICVFPQCFCFVDSNCEWPDFPEKKKKHWLQLLVETRSIEFCCTLPCNGWPYESRKQQSESPLW